MVGICTARKYVKLLADEYRLAAAKVEQAVSIMAELGLDTWLVFTQEMGDGGDPAYPLVFGERDLGLGILVINRSGRHTAIVGGLDAAIPAATPTWSNVMVHDGDFRGCLLNILEQVSPSSIAINYSTTNPKADGLSYSNYLRLQKALEGTPYSSLLVSAESLVTRLRARKLPLEVAIVRAAIRNTEAIYEAAGGQLRPGMTGQDIYEVFLAETERCGLQPAWSRDHCPVVTVGPVAVIGHNPPGQVPLQRGWTLQVDFGVRYMGYCADFQRMWYVLEEGESKPPADVQKLFDTIRRGLDVIIENIGPGVPVTQCAIPAERVLLGAGYPTFKYGLGHHIGRSVHDGGPGLGRGRPGKAPALLEPGNIVTVEGLETLLAGRGWISLEEDVLITESGVEVLTTPQAEFLLIR